MRESWQPFDTTCDEPRPISPLAVESLFKRIFYSASGPGDLVQSHTYWKRNEHNPSEVSLTFSGQIQDFCRDIGATAYFVSTHPHATVVSDGAFTLEHRPKTPRRGFRYHLEQIRYGVGLLRTALKFGADVALVDSGSTHYFVLLLFRLAGVKVVPILHNTLWPAGFPPTRLVARVVLALDGFFWRFGPAAVIAVSPECARQVDQIGRRKSYQIHQMRAQFRSEHFERVPAPPPHSRRPFRVMYVGRIEANKGVFDLLEVARMIEAAHPGLVRWEACGSGGDLEAFKLRHAELHLGDALVVRGWTSPQDLLQVYARSHAAIVPTRSSFQEGLAMTAAEAILAGRPIITSAVVPALEILRDSAIEAKTDDQESYQQCVEALAMDETLYTKLVDACAGLRAQFYDRQLGLNAVLRRALDVTGE